MLECSHSTPEQPVSAVWKEVGAMAASDPVEVITLGTAGGPRWWGQRPRSGIATAVTVGDAAYLIDCGYGAAGQLHRAGIRLDALRAVLITHLHSDHVVDLPGLMLFGHAAMRPRAEGPVPVYGPGDRGALPALSPAASSEPALPYPDNPTPGTAALIAGLIESYGTDVTDRMRDSLRVDPQELFTGVDIEPPAAAGFHPNDNPHSEMDPFLVHEDDRVRITATLVRHQPIAPALAYRIDADAGSVVVSGDTAPSDNLVRLARGADLLLHEAIDLDTIEATYRRQAPHRLAAVMRHHRTAHTTPVEAGEIAARAGVARLALHHIAPADADPSVWLAAKETFPGTVLVPDDLQLISIERD